MDDAQPHLQRSLLLAFALSIGCIMAFQTLVVNASTGVELSFIDSGPPAQDVYTTIFAVHGMIFTNRKCSPRRRMVKH